MKKPDLDDRVGQFLSKKMKKYPEIELLAENLTGKRR
jgi:hypothetical protein